MKLPERYSEPHRHYHNRQHIDECLALLASLPDLTTRERNLLKVALFYHDAVYDPAAKFQRNEIASALLFVADTNIAEEADRVEGSRLILLTAGHEAHPDDRLGQIMVSIDLAILGADEARYDEYATQIAKEYSAVPPDLYRKGRKEFLAKMYQRERLFPYPPFNERFREKARANMLRELEFLK